MLRYDDEEWTSLITKQEGWSREETDHLLDVVQALDLRWLVIADRYEVCGAGEEGGGCRAGRCWVLERPFHQTGHSL